MVRCSQCQTSILETNVVDWQMRPCSIQEGEHCFLCKEDMELERKIQVLQERRLNLRLRLNAHHDPFVLKFPPEIASYIFSLSMEARDYEPSVVSLQKLPTPFLLASVCRGWRHLARATPELWSTLSLTLMKPIT